MKNLIKYVFTVMYRWTYNLNLDSSPEWSAFVGVSVMLFVNLLSL